MLSFPRIFRCYSSAAKSQLAALRKQTGFPLSKCKEALTVNKGDLGEAEKWLFSRAQEEGWAKVEKLKDRTAKQGLIGLLIRGSKGSMVEVNCETDFVAKNEKFQSLVLATTLSVFDTPDPTLTTPSTITPFTQDQLSQLQATQEPNSPSLGDVLAGSVGLLGENLVLQRGCTLTSSEGAGLVCGHIYNNMSPMPDITMGRYGALLHLASTSGEFTDMEAVKKLGHNIAQHIIGANPAVINVGEEGVDDVTEVLTQQLFVLNEEVSVGDLLAEQGAKVTKFVRYALGET